MGSGTLLFCEKNPLEYSKIFQSGRNCIEFNNSLDEFIKLLNDTLNNSELIHMISKQGMEDAYRNHTWDQRGKNLIELLGSL